MVLGHSFSFYTQEEAERLVKFFRKEGISARIEPVAQTSLTVIIQGGYDSVYSYLTDLKEKLQAANDSEEEVDDDIILETIQEDIEDIDEILTLLKQQRENAIAGLEGKSIGDVAYDSTPSEEQDPEQMIPSLIEFMMKNKILMDNDVLGFEDHKLVYTSLKPAQELRYSYAVTNNLVPEEDDLEKHDITRTVNIQAEVDYSVKTGPEIIGRVQLEQLREELEEYDVDDDFIAHAIHSIVLKQELAEHVMQVLDSSKAGTTEELYEALELMPVEKSENPRVNNAYSISPGYAMQVIEDLKKMDLVRMKGNKIKFNR